MSRKNSKRQLRFFADENIPSEAIRLLRILGIDVIGVWELSKIGLHDQEVLELAHSQQRILLTFDKGFGERVFKFKQSTKGVVLLRFVPQSAREVVKSAADLVSREIDLENHFTVVERTRIRTSPI